MDQAAFKKTSEELEKVFTELQNKMAQTGEKPKGPGIKMIQATTSLDEAKQAAAELQKKHDKANSKEPKEEGG